MKLSHIIKTDHQKLLRRLNQFAGGPVDRESYAQLKRCLNKMSAGHYAEELTIYELTKDIATIDREYYTGYHAMLDNLYDSIRNGGHLSDALVHELNVLHALTIIHYNDEEEYILPVVEQQLEPAKSRKMAAEYQDSVSTLCQQC
ncbi:MAG: hypothetical protein HKN70_12285 [Gammaproteobacteria bacterium]|nr:hypothetical protein [Gammaproteobacteria bacterium]